jgi:hypothetical protein
VLRRIFVPERVEVTVNWRKLHNEELHNLYSFTQYYKDVQIKDDEMGESCRAHGGDEKCVGSFD